MRNIKIVMYGSIKEGTEEEVQDALLDNEGIDRVTIYSVDTSLDSAKKEIKFLNEKIRDLLEKIDD